MIQFRSRPGMAGCGVLLLILAAASLSAQTRVRVKDPAAVIRMGPAAGAAIILDSLTAGTVYPVQRRMGDWYEIKFVSPSGVLLTGYIHRSQVEGLEAEAKPAPTDSASDEQRKFASPLRPGFELGLSGGIGFNSFTGTTNLYSGAWGPWQDLEVAAESGTLLFSLGNPTVPAASCAYFFSPGLGVRFQIDWPLKQTFSESFSNYSLSWIIAGAESTSRLQTWPLTGTFSCIPISLNGVFRLALGPVIAAYVTAGPSYFLGSFQADSSMGFGASWMSTIPHLDFFTLPIRIEKTLNGFGYNAGLGLEVWAGPSLAITLEGDYYGGPSATATWAVQSGPYVSNINTGLTWTDLTLAGRSADSIPPLTIKLSFFKIAAGVKISL